MVNSGPMKLIKLVAALLVLCGSLAHADDAYLKLTGLCTGPATEPKHVGWIPLQGFGLATSNPPSGFGVTNTSGKVTIGPLKIFKAIDVCTPAIFGSVAMGSHISDAILETVNSSGDVTMKITMSMDVFIGSTNTNFASGSAQELVSLYPTKICIATYASTGATVEKCWNLKTNSQ